MGGEPGELSLRPPRTALGRGWNQLVHHVTPVRWVDEWWYGRARIPGELGSLIAEGLTYLVGGLIGLPGFILIPAARIASNTDEIHTGLLALRHRTFSLFDRAQTWQRLPDGTKVQVLPAGETPAPPGQRRSLRQIATRFASDFWTERRRLPGVILGLALPLVGLAAGGLLGTPVWVVGVVSYSVLVPVARNGVLALVHHSWDYVNRPQTIPRPHPAADGRRPVPAPSPTTPSLSPAIPSTAVPACAAREAREASQVGEAGTAELTPVRSALRRRPVEPRLIGRGIPHIRMPAAAPPGASPSASAAAGPGGREDRVTRPVSRPRAIGGVSSTARMHDQHGGGRGIG